MPGADISTAAAYLKEQYNDDTLSDLVPKATPALYFLPKYTDWTGNSYVQPVKYSNPQSVGSGSNAFPSLVNAPGSTKPTRFLLTTTKHYGVVQVDRELILASANDSGAFVSELDNEVNSCVDEMGRNFGRMAYGDGSGALGQVASISGNVITLVNKGDTANFEVSMPVDTSPNLVGGGLHDTGLIVTAVNETSGTITVSGNSATVANDYIFRANSKGNEWAGLAAWIPITPPTTGESFFGVDRSVSSRLYGQAIDGSSLNPMEALIKACMKIDKQGGRASHIFMPFEYYEAISKLQDTQKRYPQPTAEEVELGFSGIEVITPYGIARVYPDRFCPSTRMYVLSMDTWKLVSRGNLVQWIAEDGTIILRQASADAFQARVASYSNLLCLHPIANAVIYNLPDLT